MEEKSIDQLRREAQELYQAKLRAYQETQNSTPTEPEKPTTPVKKKPVTESSSPVLPLSKKEPKSTPKQDPPLWQTKNNWFVVSVFTIILIIVLIELFLFAPGR